MLKYIDLFAGAGGFGLGFKLAGYTHCCSVEKDIWAVDTLKANFSKEKIIQADLTEYHGYSDFPEGSIDVIIGGPPCQGFSVAGSKNIDKDDPRNSLFKNFAEWVGYIKPNFFVMENVKGILSKKNGKGEKISEIILRTFNEYGYKVDIWVLNAAEYGVPQLRERVFFVGNRLNLNISKPNPTHYVKVEKQNLRKAITVGEAILDLPVINAREVSEISEYDQLPQNEFQVWARNNSDKVYNHVSMNHTQRLVDRFSAIQNGNKLEDLSDTLKVKMRNGNGKLSKSKFNSNYRHLLPNNISNTIPASFYSSFIHPTIPRNITTREAARIQSFPDHYVFKGKRTIVSKKLLLKLGQPSDRLSQYNQVGNAVPPLLAKHIAEKIKDTFDGYLKTEKRELELSR